MGLSFLDWARRAAKHSGHVLAIRGRQGEDDAKRFFDVRGLGLVEMVFAFGEVRDHVEEVDARLVGQEVHAPDAEPLVAAAHSLIRGPRSGSDR